MMPKPLLLSAALALYLAFSLSAQTGVSPASPAVSADQMAPSPSKEKKSGKKKKDKTHDFQVQFWADGRLSATEKATAQTVPVDFRSRLALGMGWEDLLDFETVGRYRLEAGPAPAVQTFDLDRALAAWQVVKGLELRGGWYKTPLLAAFDLGLGGRQCVFDNKLGDAGWNDRRWSAGLVWTGAGQKDRWQTGLTASQPAGQLTPLTAFQLQYQWSKGNSLGLDASWFPTLGLVLDPADPNLAFKKILHRAAFGLGFGADWGWGSLAGQFGAWHKALDPVVTGTLPWQSGIRLFFLHEWGALAKLALLNDGETKITRFEASLGWQQNLWDLGRLTGELGFKTDGFQVQPIWGAELSLKWE